MKKNSPKRNEGVVLSSKPRLLFVGEGPQDIGREGEPGGALAGFMCAALCGPGKPRHLSELPFEIAALRKWTTLQLTRTEKKSRSRTLGDVLKLKPDGERARAAMVLAATQDLDGVVLMRDCEHADNLGVGETLREARMDYENREKNGRPALVVAAPSRCHETWLLADRAAAEQVLGEEGIHHFSSDPEQRPNCDALKQHIRKRADELHRDEHEIRSELAFRARPRELMKRCRQCYPPFHDDVDLEIRTRFGLGDSG